jgi:hypothetical protein
VGPSQSSDIDDGNYSYIVTGQQTENGKKLKNIDSTSSLSKPTLQ